MHKYIPVIKEPMNLIDQLDIKIKLVDMDYLIKHPMLQNEGLDLGFLESFNWLKERDWARQMLPKIGGRVIYSLNDMNRLNCLIRDEPDEVGYVVALIDYETSSMGYRGVDIGNHFNFHLLDLDSPTRLSKLPYASPEYQRKFVESYLDETRTISTYQDFDDKDLDSVDRVLLEAKFHGALYAMFIACFMVKPNPFFAQEGKEKFVGMIRIAITLLKTYIELKRDLRD
jgi:hypothetical protein